MNDHISNVEWRSDGSGAMNDQISNVELWSNQDTMFFLYDLNFFNLI